MTGIEDYNFPSFNAAESLLRAEGWDAINPANNFDGKTDLAYYIYLRADVAQIVTCRAIAMLPGWRHSMGAMFELLIATKLNLIVYCASTGERMIDPPTAADLAALYADAEIAHAAKMHGGGDDE